MHLAVYNPARVEASLRLINAALSQRTRTAKSTPIAAVPKVSHAT